MPVEQARRGLALGGEVFGLATEVVGREERCVDDVGVHEQYVPVAELIERDGGGYTDRREQHHPPAFTCQCSDGTSINEKKDAPALLDDMDVPATSACITPLKASTGDSRPRHEARAGQSIRGNVLEDDRKGRERENDDRYR